VVCLLDLKMILGVLDKTFNRLVTYVDALAHRNPFLGRKRQAEPAIAASASILLK
jgi:hypothetical protein